MIITNLLPDTHTDIHTHTLFPVYLYSCFGTFKKLNGTRPVTSLDLPELESL